VQYVHHYITAAGYTARKFCYKSHHHLDISVTATHGRVNVALFLELLNYTALPTYLEKGMKELCCISITTNMRFRRLQAGCKTVIQEVYMYIIG